MALINKIWHFTLPPLKGSIHYDPEQFHGNYKILMEKMVRYSYISLSFLLGRSVIEVYKHVSLLCHAGLKTAVEVKNQDLSY